MDIFFQDPSEIPLPADEVRIRELRAEVKPDGRRVGIYLEVDPFQKRPNADVIITNQAGQTVAETSIIESLSRKMEFVMHLRQPEPKGQYRVSATLFFTEPIPEPKDPQEGKEPELPKLPEPVVVDRAETTFTIEPG